MDRRAFLGGTAAVTCGAVAGCGFILGDEPLAVEAEVARVADSTADSAGYELEGVSDQTIERTFEVAGESRTVVATNRLAAYEKRVAVGELGDRRAAFFTALSTPAVSVLGESFNPVAHLSTAELAELLQDRFGELESMERQGESPVSILDTETTQTRFDGRATLEAGQQIEVSIHVSEPVQHEDDLVIGVGGYPRLLPDESSTIVALMEGIEHPVS